MERGFGNGDVLRSMASNGWSPIVDHEAPDHVPDPARQNLQVDYPGLTKAYDGPSTECLKIAESPIALFFYFMQVSLCRHIAACSNAYHHEKLSERVEAVAEKERKRARRAQGDRKLSNPCQRSATINEADPPPRTLYLYWFTSYKSCQSEHGEPQQSLENNR